MNQANRFQHSADILQHNTGKGYSPAETDGEADAPGALVVTEGLVVTADTVVLVAGTADKRLGSGTGKFMLRPGCSAGCSAV